MASEWTGRFSHRVMVPVQADGPAGSSGRLIPDWRGIPVLLPMRFEAVPENRQITVIKAWIERGNLFIKLVHPENGTTVDYAVRCPFNPAAGSDDERSRSFVFLELPPGVGPGVPVWTVVEWLRSSAVRSLTAAEAQAEMSTIRTIVEEQWGVEPTALERLFGPLAEWENPDWGDAGNIHRVCVRCLRPLEDWGKPCPDCASGSFEKLRFWRRPR